MLLYAIYLYAADFRFPNSLYGQGCKGADFVLSSSVAPARHHYTNPPFDLLPLLCALGLNRQQNIT
jgi:hypothetical protein